MANNNKKKNGKKALYDKGLQLAYEAVSTSIKVTHPDGTTTEVLYYPHGRNPLDWAKKNLPYYTAVADKYRHLPDARMAHTGVDLADFIYRLEQHLIHETDLSRDDTELLATYKGLYERLTDFKYDATVPRTPEPLNCFTPDCFWR